MQNELDSILYELQNNRALWSKIKALYGAKLLIVFLCNGNRVARTLVKQEAGNIVKAEHLPKQGEHGMPTEIKDILQYINDDKSFSNRLRAFSSCKFDEIRI